MKENKYNDPVFLKNSIQSPAPGMGLLAAGEADAGTAAADFAGKEVLDLGAATAGTASTPPNTAPGR